MNKEGLSTHKYEAHQKRIDFIEKAVGEGILDRIPVSERDQNIALVYYLNEELTGEKVGKAFPQSSGKPLGRESVSQKGEKLLRAAHNAVSPPLQASHPLSELLTKKPQALTEVTGRIRRAYERGASPKEIINTEGIAALTTARATLRKHGTEIQTDYEHLKTRVKAETDDKKLQEILDSFTDMSLKGYLYSQDPERIFAGLSSVLRKGGFHIPPQFLKLFAEKLNANGIPFRPVAKDKSTQTGTYWIVFDKHKQRIIDALKDDPDLQRFKSNHIRLICGKPDRIPTTADFKKTKRFKQYGTNIQGLIEEVTGYYITGRESTFEVLLRGCPVPVFKHGSSYIYPIDKIGELKAFLKSKRGTV